MMTGCPRVSSISRAMLMQPLRRVLRPDQIPGEDVGGSGRGREPGHRAWPVASLPGSAQGTHRCGLPSPCGADEYVEDAAGDADLRDRLLLVHRQGVPVAVLRSGSVLDPCQRYGRRRPIIRRAKESVFCREHLLGGEHRSGFGSEHARPVRATKQRGLFASSGGVRRSETRSAASTICWVMTSRSFADAKRRAIVCRTASAWRFHRFHVARRSPTCCTTTSATSSRSSNGISSARSNGSCSLPASSADAQVGASSPSNAVARSRHWR